MDLQAQIGVEQLWPTNRHIFEQGIGSLQLSKPFHFHMFRTGPLTRSGHSCEVLATYFRRQK